MYYMQGHGHGHGNGNGRNNGHGISQQARGGPSEMMNQYQDIISDGCTYSISVI